MEKPPDDATVIPYEGGSFREPQVQFVDGTWWPSRASAAWLAAGRGSRQPAGRDDLPDIPERE